VYELRNKSRTQCDLTGIPALRFFDKAGSPISLDYLKNLSAFMFSAEPVHSVLLQPGEFAHFLVGWDVCNDTPCWHPDSMAILLPNGKFLSKTPARWQGVGKLSVSAVRTGLKQDYLDELPPKDKERLLTLSAGR
jgi:hypothetical protein